MCACRVKVKEIKDSKGKGSMQQEKVHNGYWLLNKLLKDQLYNDGKLVVRANACSMLAALDFCALTQRLDF